MMRVLLLRISTVSIIYCPFWCIVCLIMLCSRPLLKSIVVPSLPLPPACVVDIAEVSSRCCPHVLRICVAVSVVALVSVSIAMSGLLLRTSFMIAFLFFCRLIPLQFCKKIRIFVYLSDLFDLGITAPFSCAEFLLVFGYIFNVCICCYNLHMYYSLFVWCHFIGSIESMA